MSFQEYPKWLYSASEPARIVKDKDEQSALGDGWSETPVPDAELEVIAPNAEAPAAEPEKPKGKRGRKPKVAPEAPAAEASDVSEPGE